MSNRLLNFLLVATLPAWPAVLQTGYDSRSTAATVIAQAGQPLVTATALRVHDGDTVVLSKGKLIRLACIDAPELGQRLGRESRQALLEVVPKGSTFLYQQTNSNDRYGRIVALVYSTTGLSAQETLVSRGLAVVYQEYQKGCPTALLNSLQAEAIQTGKGMWNQNQWNEKSPLCLPSQFRKKQCK